MFMQGPCTNSLAATPLAASEVAILYWDLRQSPDDGKIKLYQNFLSDVNYALDK